MKTVIRYDDVEVLQRHGYELLDDKLPQEEGGFGVVYKVRAVHSKIPYAAKTLRPQWRDDERIKDSFRREATSWLGLNPPYTANTSEDHEAAASHRHIARADSFIEDEKTQTRFLILEYVQGVTLHELIHRAGGKLTVPAMFDLAIQFCRGMEYCGYRRPGFVHRDIKPGNVMVSGENVAKIIDFGLSRSVGQNTGLTTLAVCSPDYAPVEQMNRGTVSVRSDVFSFGVSMVEMLTGTPQKNRVDVRQRTQHLGKDLAPVVEMIVKCLSFTTALRFGSFSELRAELERLDREIVGPWAATRNFAICHTCRFVGDPAIQDCPLGPHKAAVKSPVPVLQQPRGPEQKPEPPIQILVNEPAPAPPFAPAPTRPFVRIDAGQFMAGTCEQEIDALKFPLTDDFRTVLLRNPKKNRTIARTYWISKTAVTNEDYWRFVRETGHPLPAGWAANVARPFPEEMTDYPVTGVSWHDATAYCAHYGFRLPTDDEWERAARGTSGRLYAWGDQFDRKRCNGKESNRGKTVPVDALLESQSEDGLLNITGNTWEWTEPSRILDAGVRGGSFRDDCELGALGFFDEFPVDASSGRDNFGFRICRTASAAEPATLIVKGHALVKVPAGRFKTGVATHLGSQVEHTLEKYGLQYAGEFHEEEHFLPDFYISKYPVTNEEYLAFARGHNRPFPEHWLTDAHRPPFSASEARLPVVNVSVADASAFCQGMSSGFFLPTDLQWEKAARGSDGRLYPWGNQFDASKCHCRERSARAALPVDSGNHASSPYGVVGMAGNVWEWIRRVHLRGGSFKREAELFGLGYLGRATKAGERDDDVGFRCVRDA